MGYAVSPQYSLSPGGNPLDAQLSFVGYGCTISNLTNQWLFVDTAQEFVPPYTSGRNIPLSGSQRIGARFLAPVGFTNPTAIGGQLAYIRATEQPLLSAPGLPVAPAQFRWNITHAPATGTQASVSKAASPGIVHIFDAAVFALIQTTGAASVVAAFLRDGPAGTGAVLLEKQFSVEAVNGFYDDLAISNLGIKCTVGNAATIEFGAGAALIVESVSAVGYDA